MYVCECCLAAIESHEGTQFVRRIDWEQKFNMPDGIIFESEEDDEEVMICEWCDEEIPVDQMYEMR